MPAQVIILNGVSSAGKSTLARKIQALSDRAWLHVAMDDFLSMLPDGKEFEADWFPVGNVVREGDALPRIENGPRGERLLQAMRAFVGASAASGLDLIVDEVCHAAEMADYRQRISGTDIRVIKVSAPLAEIERREKERGNRLIGLAREQSRHLHEGIRYDLEIDTGAETTMASAERILDSFNT